MPDQKSDMDAYKPYHLYDRMADSYHQLHTATDVIDLVAEEVATMVVVLNVDQPELADRFDETFARAFDVALPEFLRRLALQGSDGRRLALLVQARFIDEQEDRMAEDAA